MYRKYGHKYGQKRAMKTNWTHTGIKSLTDAKPHRVDKCLYIRVSDSGHKRWVFRWRDRTNSRLRDMGLGSFPDVSLADAKAAASEHRKQIREGFDPIAERQRLTAEIKAAAGKIPSFSEACEAYISAHEAGWKNEKHVAQWRSTLKTYAGPVIGDLPVHLISDEHIVKVLDPIWITKTETASRVRGRIERVLDWATARKYREGLNPARWKGHLDTQFPAPSKLKKVKHHESLAYSDVYSFVKELEKQKGIAARALEFTILTAARTGEVIAAEWSEFDLKAAVWTIPADRMKAGKPHRVPLSKAAVGILKGQRGHDSKYVLPGIRDGKHLSNMAMLELLKDMDKDFTVHGFRSTFRNWAAERTSFPRDVCEASLAHTLKDKTEAAYLHSDLLEKRVAIMDRWSKHCLAKPTQSNITQLEVG